MQTDPPAESPPPPPPAAEERDGSVADAPLTVADASTRVVALSELYATRLAAHFRGNLAREEVRRRVSLVPPTYQPRAEVMVQAAGHAGTFTRKEGMAGVIVKEATVIEAKVYEELALLGESLDGRPFAAWSPRFHSSAIHGAIAHIALGDVTAGLSSPCVMDIKMGSRTFLEAELGNSKRRLDLRDKVNKADPTALSEEEQELGITKLRYLSWRDAASSSSSLGFRIEGIRRGDGKYDGCNLLREIPAMIKALRWFLGSSQASLRTAFLSKLVALRDALAASPWFLSHELVASSLLFVYDGHNVSEPAVYMIDFAKTSALEPGQTLSHDAAWVPGNREDGYLTGLDSCIRLFREMHNTEHDWSAPRSLPAGITAIRREITSLSSSATAAGGSVGGRDNQPPMLSPLSSEEKAQEPV